MSSSLSSYAFAFLCLGLSTGAVACAAESDPPNDADEPAGDVTGEADLRAAGIKSIEVRRSAGFRPPPPVGKCWESGAWSYDFEAKKLTGNACVGSKRVTLDKTLSAADHERVRQAMLAIKVGPKPAACPTDMPVSSLAVKRATTETAYVDQRAACGGGSKPVTEGLSELVTLMQDLSATSAKPACIRTGCSGQICADANRISTCEMRPEYACYQAATCERGADGQCGFRQTPQLAACLASK
jgi:hypothetical protein